MPESNIPLEPSAAVPEVNVCAAESVFIIPIVSPTSTCIATGK